MHRYKHTHITYSAKFCKNDKTHATILDEKLSPNTLDFNLSSFISHHCIDQLRKVNGINNIFFFLVDHFCSL